jgi:hypothetical protein
LLEKYPHEHQTLLRIGILGNKIIEVLISTVMTPASKAEGKSTQF